MKKISEERYRALSATYEIEQAQLRAKQSDLVTEITRSDEAQENIQQFSKLIQKHTDIQELNPRLLHELIDKIVVHEKETDANGKKSQRVDIYYKFIGYIDILAQEKPIQKGELVMMTFDEEDIAKFEDIPLFTDESIQQELLSTRQECDNAAENTETA